MEDEYYEEEYVEDDVYSANSVDELTEDDELDAQENAFMRGYDLDADAQEKTADAAQGKVCPECGVDVDLDDEVCSACGASLRLTAEDEEKDILY